VRPNVLLIIFDTARADAFEPYGAPAGSTPAFADLASSGQISNAMFAPACWTLPSHASLFTGLLPRATGLTQAPEGLHTGSGAMDTQRERLLPEVLRRAGYETGAVSANMWISKRNGFANGFDRFVEVDTGRQSQIHAEGRRASLAWDYEGVRARVDDGATEVGRVLRGWMSERSEKPFFWFVNLIECHSPYLPPKPFNDLGPIDRLRAAREARRYLTMGAIWRACAGGFDVPDDALERMRRLYAGAVRALDEWLADVLEGLDASGLLDETLVIVTSDHGENFGENGLMGHAFSLDNRLLHLPFVAAGPGAFAPTEAHSLAEAPRLIADALGVEDHPWIEQPADGVAVAQFDPPTGPDDPRVEQALGEWGLGPEAAPRITTELTTATDGRYKLLMEGDRELVYDLASDPLELAPIDPQTLGAKAEAFRGAIRHSAATKRADAPEPAGADQEISEEERQQLEDRMRLLGYL
jgi:arylsulfatase A-like enzyme